MIPSSEKYFGSPVCWDESTPGVTYLGFVDNSIQNEMLNASDSTDYTKKAIFLVVKIAVDPNDANITLMSSPDGMRKYDQKFSDRALLNYKPLQN